MSTCTALIVAAGRGHRLGGEIPKQYLDLGGIPLLRRTVQAFASHPHVDEVVVVIHPDDESLYGDAVDGLALPPPVCGGASRQESVRLGLNALAAAAPTYVLIHDAARPFVSHALISRVMAALDDASGAVPAQQVADTLKRANDGMVTQTVARDHLWRAQTPQGFKFGDILDAHQICKDMDGDLTDDSSVAEQTRLSVRLVDGDEMNFKVTTADDLVRAERELARGGETRCGTGFDVHRFCAGDNVTLCGILIPHDQGLKGHSDADVALHALTDALLGAIGDGDIGTHFPPSDPQWKGCDSTVFLTYAADRIAKRGGQIINVDLTIICETPKIGPRRQAMIKRISMLLDLPPDRVSIKGTTTEGLGFTGRGEGIAVQALASVQILR